MLFDTTYYVAPGAVGAKPYALLVRALQSTGKVAIVRFVMRSRQYTTALRADQGRLVLSTLAYADEIVPSRRSRAWPGSTRSACRSAK